MSDHIETRRKLQNIAEVHTFEDLLNSCMLTEEDRTIIRLHYLKGKDLAYIADELGYSESTIKRRHRKILSKLNKVL